ncbi:MAG: hypothetical protein ACOYXB_12105, partial [Bacteroidota bacterium]
MKSWQSLIFTIFLTSLLVPLSGQVSGELSETVGNEGNMRTGGQTIELIIHGTTFDAALGSDATLTTEFYNGMTGSAAWELVKAALLTTSVSVTDDTIATITLPAVAAYFITENDTVTFVIPDNCIAYSGDLSIPEKIIVLNSATSVSFGGTIRSSVSEADIRTSSHTYTLTLANNEWRSDIKEDSVLGYIQGMFSPAASALITAMTTADINVTGGNVLTITFPANSSYYLSSSEAFTVTPADNLAKYPETITGGSDNFTIANTDPQLSFTNVSYTEASIRTSPHTFTISLTGDEWADPVASNLKDAFVGDTAWDNQIRDLLTFTYTTSTVSVTIPAIPGFDMAVTDNITLSVNSTHLLHSSGTYAATGTLTLTPTAPSVSVSGTSTLIGSVTEESMRTSTHSIVLTLSEEVWPADLETNATLRATLINGLTASGTGWTTIRDAILGTDSGNGRVHLNGLQVTIDVPAEPDFDISSSISLSASIASSLLSHTPAGLSVSGFCTITPKAASMRIYTNRSPLTESNLDNSLLYVKLFEDTFADGTFSISNFTLTPNFSGRLRIQNTGDITYVAADSIIIQLSYNDDFDSNQNLSLYIAGSELSNTSAGLTSENTLLIIASIEPVIDTVYYPNAPMGIGDVVNVTIKLAESDGGKNFTLLGGKVAGRDLVLLPKTDAYTYNATFTILENSTDYTAAANIPIENVQLSNEGTPGNVFSTNSTNNNDPIDSRKPVIDLLSVSGGSYRIGQTIPLVLHADGNGYQLVEASTFVNTIPATSPDITWSEAGSGIYQLYYTISDGDPDVSGSFPVSAVMADAVGNSSNAYSTVSGTLPLIDATAPAIDSMVVLTTGVVKVGEIVEVLIYTHEGSLTPQPGTVINNVPVSATRVSFAPFDGDTIYILSYTVAAGDASVLSGNLECTVILKDAAGNEASQDNNLLHNNVAINTQLPTATIIGGGEICMGDSIRLYVNITGAAPFDLQIYMDGNPYISVTDVSSPYGFYVKPASDATYTVFSVTDNINNSSAGSGSAEVLVHLATAVQITNSRDTYDNSEGKVLLTANVGPGVFSGDGVETSTGYFYPAWIEPDGSWHTIRYVYTNSFGCVSEDTRPFSVIKGSAIITVDSIICFNQGPTEIIGDNVENNIGTFVLYNSGEQLLSEGLVDNDLNDNRAQLIPSELKGGYYLVGYRYKYGGIDREITRRIYIDKVPVMEIISGPDAKVCEQDPKYDLRGNLDNFNEDAQFMFFGNGVSGTMIAGFTFDPSAAPLGTNRITYKYISENGCADSVYSEVINRFVPNLSFGMSSTCIPSDGGEISFSNLTDEPDSVLAWSWTFGDINSGEFNLSSEFAPVHDYTAPGNRKIILDAETNRGCSVSIDSTVDFGDKPVAAFNWVSDCFLNDVPVEFENTSFSELAWQSHIWKFYDRDDQEIGSITVSDAGSIGYTFPSMDDYSVKLIATNLIPQTGQTCSDSISKSIVLKPTISLADSSYFETFNELNPRWGSSSTTVGVNSWSHGIPDFPGLVTELGNMAWYTNLDNKAEEESWVSSPCFDFRDMDRPMIRMDILRSFDRNRDGAVLEYSLNDGRTWVREGDYNEGIEWYNAFDIINKPNNNSIGWSGTSMDEADTTWIESAHSLDDLKGETSVVFRVIYATDGGSVEENYGFAFDNVYIGERSKKVMLEHFTSSADSDSKSADDFVDNIQNTGDSLDLINIQYHMAYPGEDPMNLNNPAPAASRSFYYGINTVPYAVMDGGYAANTRYDFISLNPQTAVLHNLALERPKFDLKLNVSKESDHLRVTAKITANESMNVDKLQLNLAVVESEVTTYTGGNGDALFRNVVLAMLPGPAGTLFEQDWELNAVAEKSYSWTYSNVEDPDDIKVIGFIQNYETGRIYQSVSEDGSGSTSVSENFVSLHELLLYPNPATSEVIVVPGFTPENDILIRICDITGKPVM